MITLNTRRGQVYFGESSPLAFTDDDDNIVTPEGPGPKLIAALNKFTFDPTPAEGEEFSLNGQVVARMTDGTVVPA